MFDGFRAIDDNLTERLEQLVSADGKPTRHPSTTHLLSFFSFEHLPEKLQGPSRACAVLAITLVEHLPDGPELTTGLRKLLEAKDSFVRAAL